MLFGLLSQIGDVDVAVRRGRDHDHAHARHRAARRVGAVRRGGDQDDVTVRVAAIAVVGADHHQARELALRAGIGLERHRAEARNLLQRLLQLRDDLRVALRLVGGDERMDAREVLPRHRQHLGRGVQLHRARAERNHRRVEADVLPLQRPDVAHHLRLRAMRVEDRVGHEGGCSPGAGIRDPGSAVGPIDRSLRCAQASRKDVDDVLDVGCRHGFVQRDANRRAVDVPEVDAGLERRPPNRVDARRNVEPQRVEIGRVGLPDSERGELPIENPSQLVDAAGNRFQTLRPVVYPVHRGHVGEERLRRADVRRRLLPPDVLLARRQRHPVRLVAVCIDRHADDAAGRLPDEGMAGREERRRPSRRAASGAQARGDPCRPRRAPPRRARSR